jgi:hypothetical protein|uniref:Uncharacterized protein n=1 Tax=viral metagenome TaxID=1070528 RepID=A0A6C0EYM4_9ZZZZ
MLKKNDSSNKLMNGQFLLFILFVLYIIFNIQTPEPIASIVDSTLGYVVIIGLFALMAVNLHPVVTLVGVFAIYLLFKRSSISTGSLAMTKFLPTENVKSQYLSAFNQFPVTLEEEVVQQMAPLQSGPSMSPKSFSPILNDLHDAANVNYNGVV